MKKYIALHDVAEAWGVSEQTVRRAVHDPLNPLPVVRIRGQLRFDPVAVQAWTEAQQARQAIEQPAPA